MMKTLSKFVVALVATLILVATALPAFAGGACMVTGPFNLRVRSLPVIDESTIQITAEGPTLMLSHRKVVTGMATDQEARLWYQIEQGWVAGWVARTSGDCENLPATFEFTSTAPAPTPAPENGGGSQGNAPAGETENPVVNDDGVFTAEEAAAMYGVASTLTSCGQNCWSVTGATVTNPHSCWVSGYLANADGVANQGSTADDGDDKVGIPPGVTALVEAANLYPGC